MTKKPRFFCTKVEVRKSGRQGRGMFATQKIKSGEWIEVAPTLLIPPSEADELLTTFLAHYIFRTDRGRRYVVGLGSTSLFNHSARPNAEFFVSQHMVKIKATRAIRVGEEVLVAYGWTDREWQGVGGYVG